MKELGIYEIHALSNLIDEETVDDELAKFDRSTNIPEISGMYGVTLFELRQTMDILEKAIDNALRKIEIPRGARPNLEARFLALFILEVLLDREIKATTYDDGIYFRILSVAIADTFPELGEEAYRRHGAWALKIIEYERKYEFAETRSC